jgi:hypothetical protein
MDRLKYIKVHRAIALPERQKAAEKQLSRRHDVVPVVVDFHSDESHALARHKYAVPAESTLARLRQVVQRHCEPEMDAAKALFATTVHFESEKDTPTFAIPTPSATVGQTYTDFASNDKVLYMLYSAENVFG